MTRGRRQRLGEALEEYLGRKSRGGGSGKRQAQVDAVWNEVVGEDIARHTMGFGVHKGELRVHVDSHAWAAQLTHMGEDLRARLNEVLGKEVVGAIRFTVSRTVSDEHKRRTSTEEAARRYGGDRVAAVSLDEREREEVEREVAHIKNERLREAAIRARVAHLEWEKGLEAAKSRDRPSEDA